MHKPRAEIKVIQANIILTCPKQWSIEAVIFGGCSCSLEHGTLQAAGQGCYHRDLHLRIISILFLGQFTSLIDRLLQWTQGYQLDKMFGRIWDCVSAVPIPTLSLSITRDSIFFITYKIATISFSVAVRS